MAPLPARVLSIIQSCSRPLWPLLMVAVPPASPRPLLALTGTGGHSWSALAPSLLLSGLHLLLLPSHQSRPTLRPTGRSTPGSSVLPCLPAGSDSRPSGRRRYLTVSSSATHFRWQPDRACETRDGPDRDETQTTFWGLQSPLLTAPASRCFPAVSILHTGWLALPWATTSFPSYSLRICCLLRRQLFPSSVKLHPFLLLSSCPLPRDSFCD